ncbi:hypothetical protein [Telmatospirillum siberiense]|uniref:Lipoprotein n=1 Tax=Telmatospirillum siberiense TaxID=382514 RepID=A0A2N3PXK6_9PROT|nr:hypothetical protein [Telmatospirillum siberiense]PKU25115.1 hypothetical protein CWS72_07910 [Telmatospirillum siberiense]
MRNRFGVINPIIVSFALSGCVAVWGGSYNVESEDANGGAIRYDHVVISARAVQVKAGEICAKYQKIAVIQVERGSVILPGGSVDEITFACVPPTTARP